MELVRYQKNLEKLSKNNQQSQGCPSLVKFPFGLSTYLTTSAKTEGEPHQVFHDPSPETTMTVFMRARVIFPIILTNSGVTRPY